VVRQPALPKGTGFGTPAGCSVLFRPLPADGWVLVRAAKLLFRASKEGDYKSGHKAEIRDPESVEWPIDFTGGAA